MSKVEKEALVVRDRARSTARILSKRGHWRKRLYSLLKGLNVIIGMSLLSITFVPQIRIYVGVEGVEFGSAIAAFILIADVVVPMLISTQPPDLYFIYAFYTDSYATQIEQVLMEEPRDKHDKAYRNGRLSELLRHARLNFDDLRVKFPGLLPESRDQPRSASTESAT